MGYRPCWHPEKENPASQRAGFFCMERYALNEWRYVCLECVPKQAVILIQDSVTKT